MFRLRRWIQSDAGLNDEAALRFVLGKSGRTNWQSALTHILAASAMITFMIVFAERFFPPQGTVSAKILGALYGFTIAGQAVVSAAAFSLTVHMIGGQRRRRTWDQLRATAGGTLAALRAAWAATVYYRLSGLLGMLVYAPRVLLLGLLLWDLTAFRGEYLTMIAGGHAPALPPFFELPLLGAFIAAAFIVPLSALGLETAVGLLFSTFARSRQTASLLQFGLTIVRVLWAVIAVSLMSDLLNTVKTSQLTSETNGVLIMLVNGAAGDWGLSGLHAETVDSLWANIPYSAYVGAGLLGVVLIHSSLTVIVLRWAARRAQRLE